MSSRAGMHAPGDSREERLYDEYLDLLLHSEAVSPLEYCEKHGGSSTLKGWLDGAYKMLVSQERKTDSRIASIQPRDVPFTQLGDYRLINPIGEGGMGTVYIAEQISLGRVVALKLIRPELVASPTSRTRFEREARAIAKVNHPNIVKVFGSGRQDNIQYFAMEFVPGRSLQDAISENGEQGIIPIPRVLKWILQISRAVDAAHKAGILHRDIKPSNIRINPNDDALLVDFGLARSTHEDSTLITYSFAGSPSYASPEQIANRSGGIDERSDVYALGTTLYESLSGRVPFEGDTLERLMHRVMTVEPIAPSRLNSSISKDLETVVLCAMDKNPDRRYQSAQAFADDLEAILEFRPIRARSAGLPTRIAKWTRRNPVRAVAFLAILMLLMAIPGVWLIQKNTQARDARRTAGRLMQSAQEELTRVDRIYADAQEAWWTATSIRTRATTRWLTPMEDTKLKVSDEVTRQNDRERQIGMAQAFSLLSQAQRLDADSPNLSAAWSAFYFQKWLDARSDNPDVAKLYRSELVKYDVNGESLSRLAGAAQLTIGTDPPGADVYLLRYQDQSDIVTGGEQRQVLTPRFEDTIWPVPPGTLVLRILEDYRDAKANDHIVTLGNHPVAGAMIVARSSGEVELYDRLHMIDGEEVSDSFDLARLEYGTDLGETRTYTFERGGEDRGDYYEVEALNLEGLGVLVLSPSEFLKEHSAPVELWSDGVLSEVLSVPGLNTRLTASPFFLGPHDWVGSTPIPKISIDAGNYLLVIRLDAHEDIRVPFHIDHPTRPYGGNVDIRVDLPRKQMVPSGFVYIPSDATHREGDRETVFWIMAHEVTVGQYLEFLNAEETLHKIKVEKERTLVPSYPNWDQPNRWRTRRGKYFVPDELSADMPILGLTWFAANEFVQWKNRSIDLGDFEFTLPSQDEWTRAVAGETTRVYVYGDKFQPKWMKSSFSRRATQPEPVGSYPIDESPYGIFDMGGSASEWCVDAAYDDPLAHRIMVGGSWFNNHPTQFQRTHSLWYSPDSYLPFAGLRMMIRAKSAN